MKNALYLVAAALIFSLSACNGELADDPVDLADFPECDPDNGGINLPDGFCAYVVAESTGPARHLTVAQNGDVFVRIRDAKEGGGGIAALRDSDGDGRADVVERFNETSGTGIKIQNGYLYYSTKTSVHRYPYSDGQLVPEVESERIVYGLPEQSSHEAKTFDLDGQGNLYLNSGAPSNNCQEEIRTAGSPGRQPCDELELSGGIWLYGADETDQEHMPDNRYATGLRHSVALAWNDAAGGLYAVPHGRDQLNQLWPDLYDAEQNAELPSEEFVMISEGDDFGWPYCYHDWQQGVRVVSPEYGGDGLDTGDCDQYQDPILAFPGHFAPNDLMFYTGDQFPSRYRGGAFVAFHGSWNRAPEPQRGYKVAFVPFDGTTPSGDWEVFADDFAGVDPIPSPNQAEFRPMGLAQGPEGTLYVSDSQQGRIWRIIYRGE